MPSGSRVDSIPGKRYTRRPAQFPAFRVSRRAQLPPALFPYAPQTTDVEPRTALALRFDLEHVFTIPLGGKEPFLRILNSARAYRMPKLVKYRLEAV
jgi:hypothetical protein